MATPEIDCIKVCRAGSLSPQHAHYRGLDAPIAVGRSTNSSRVTLSPIELWDATSVQTGPGSHFRANCQTPANIMNVPHAGSASRRTSQEAPSKERVQLQGCQRGRAPYTYPAISPLIRRRGNPSLNGGQRQSPSPEAQGLCPTNAALQIRLEVVQLQRKQARPSVFGVSVAEGPPSAAWRIVKPLQSWQVPAWPHPSSDRRWLPTSLEPRNPSISVELRLD